MAAASSKSESCGSEELCTIHTEEKIQGMCDTCKACVCVKCMLGTHNGHMFKDIQQSVTESREHIQKESVKLRAKLALMQQRAIEIGILDDKDQSQSEGIVDNIKQRGQTLKSYIDSIVTTLVANVENQRKDNQQKLEQFRTCMSDDLSQIRTFLDGSENNIKDTSDIQLLQVHEENTKWMQKISKIETMKYPDISFPRFVVGQDSHDALQAMVGKLFIDFASSLNLINTKVTSSLSVMEKEICNICLYKDSQILARGMNEKEIKLLKIDGETIQTMPVTRRIYDMAANTDGAILLTCPQEQCITKTFPGEKTELFINILRLKPLSICINRCTSDILVGLVDKWDYNTSVQSQRLVRMYSCTGELLKDFQYQDKKNFFGRTQKTNLFTLPHRLDVNPSTGDIAVVNWVDEFSGEIVVLDSNGKLKYKHVDQEENFSPWEAKFDVLNNIIISDRYNRHIKLLDSSGKFIRVLNVFTATPLSMVSFSDGKLCVGLQSGKISMIQYMA